MTRSLSSGAHSRDPLANPPAGYGLFIAGAENMSIGDRLLAPAMQVIAKPFEMGALVNKVREIIEGGHGLP